MTGQAILFDGTTDFMTRADALDGVVNSKTGIFSSWIRIDGGDGTTRNFFITSLEKVRLRFQNNNRLQFVFRNGNPAAQYRTSVTLTASAGYFHVLSSWDMGNDIVQLYVDDVDRTDLEFPLVDSTLDRSEEHTSELQSR